MRGTAFACEAGAGMLLAGVLALFVFAGDYTIMEDALITARHARRLAEGAGLTYQDGVSALGTTTPAWAVLSSPLFLVPGSDELRARLVQLSACAFLLLAVSLAARSLAPGPARAVLYVGIACTPSIVAVGKMGMETGAIILAVVLLWRSLARGREVATSWLWRGGLIALMLLLRLDMGAVAAALGVTHLASRRQREVWVGVVATAAVAALLLGSWLAYCEWHFGSLLPQSMLAKSRSGYGLSVVRIDAALAERWLETAWRLGYFNFPWPRVIAFLVPGVWLAAAAVLACVLAWRLSRGSIPDRLRLGSALLFWGLYAGLLSIGGAVGVYPWYRHVPTFCLVGACLMVFAARLDRLTARVGLLLLLLAFGTPQLIEVSGTLLKGDRSNAVLHQTGVKLRQLHAPSIMLEPIGYIGYYSRAPRVYDLGGLVSPDVFALRRTGHPGWFSEAVERFRPEYVVLRSGELESNLGLNVGVLFASDDQRRAWSRSYRLVWATGAPGMVVYQRTNGQSLAALTSGRS